MEDKEIIKKYHREYMREWRKRNPNKSHESYERRKDKIKKYSKIYRLKNKEKIKAYKGKYRKDNWEKVKEGKRKCWAKNPNLYRAMSKKYREKNKEEIKIKKREKQKEYSENPLNKIKINARNKARVIKIKKGVCNICGNKNKLEKHHDDYSKPLEVIFLCRSCHKKLHIQEELCE